MRRELGAYETLAVGGVPVGRAVVTRTWGSAPRQPGALLLVSSERARIGSVSGGCVENAVVDEVLAAMAHGAPRAVRYGIADADAWTVGLACGGTLDVWVEPAVRPELRARAGDETAFVLATVLAGPAAGAAWLLDEDRTWRGPLPPAGGAEVPPAAAAFADAVRARAAALLAGEACVVETVEPTGGAPAEVFFEVVARTPRLVLVGGVHIAQELAPMAAALGFHTVLVDARAAYADETRFPDVHERHVGWPADVLRTIRLDAWTYVCVLSHDPKLDEPAVSIALASDAAYVGAIGSRRTQAARRERLRAGGLDEAQVARLHGPIGLPLGGRRPAEIALAILAEITQVRNQAPQ